MDGDWNEIFEEVEAEYFVGREQEIESFRQHITFSRPRYLIFYITGQGGSGKTTLLNRYREISQQYSFLLASCDEYQRDVPAALGHFALQLTEQGFPLKDFNERYKTYRQKLHEIENDPEAPQGVAATLARTMVRAIFIGGHMVPGVSKGLEYVPRDQVETQASEWVTYLAKKFSNKDDVALMREPISVLTPLFFRDLNEIAQKQKVLLCFDNFEATSSEFQEWLLRLREYKPALNIRIAIAGRDQPGAKWDALRSALLTIRLDVFKELEAEMFLDVYGVTDYKRRREILELSGRLPVLMSWLAVAENQAQEANSLPSQDIVDRFLKWVTDPVLKEVALLAAIPRSFNADVLKLLFKSQEQTVDEQVAFDWLHTMPFVKQGAEGWYYHDVVRRMMLHYQRQKSPEMYRRTHKILANYYDVYRQERTVTDESQWRNEDWRKYTHSYTYHLLVFDSNKHWSEVMNLFVVAVRKRRSFAIEMMELLNLEDVYDELSHKQKNIVQLFLQKLQAIKVGSLKDGFEMFDSLCYITGLSAQAKGYVFAYRGECYRLTKKFEKALKDFENALIYLPEDDWAIAKRGEVYQEMGQYEEALADFDRAIALDENYDWAIAHRGEVYQEMGQYEEALADFDRAIALDESYVWALLQRSQVYRSLERYEEALADLDRAIALDKNKKTLILILKRGEVYKEMGRYEEAVADYEQAVALGEDEAWIIIIAGEAYREMGRHEAALASFDKAIADEGEEAHGLAHRGRTYLSMKQYGEALADFDRAIALGKNDENTLGYRGRIYLLMERYGEALADFDRAIALDEKDALTIVCRGTIYLLMERYGEALADFDRAVALDENNVEALEQCGKTHLLMRQYKEALADFDRAIALDNTVTWVVAGRGLTYRAMRRYEEALADFDRVIALDNKFALAFHVRGGIYSLMGRYEEALADFDQAIALGYDSYNEQGLVLSYLERYDAAIVSYKQGLEVRPDNYELLYNIAVSMVRGGFPHAQRYLDEARTALQNEVTINAIGAGFYGLGGLEAVVGNVDDALDHLNKALRSTNSEVIEWARQDMAWEDLRRCNDLRFRSLIPTID